MSMQCMNAWLQQFWGSTLRIDLYAVCDPSSKKEERRSWSLCRKPYHNHQMWWAERYRRRVASKQVSRSWACFPSFYNQAFWDPNENAKQMMTWDDWQKSRGTVNTIITFTRATIALGQCMMWRLNLAQMVMLYRQQTPNQACMHTPAMHAGQQTQAQQPWIILKSHRGGDGGANSKSMMMPLICSCDWHSFNLLACTKNWSKWSLTCLGHNPFSQSLDLKNENLWIPISGQASSESWSLGILFCRSLDLERKKKVVKHSTICDHTLKQNFMKVLLLMCNCPILLLLCCCIWESK